MELKEVEFSFDMSVKIYYRFSVPHLNAIYAIAFSYPYNDDVAYLIFEHDWYYQQVIWWLLRLYN